MLGLIEWLAVLAVPVVISSFLIARQFIGDGVRDELDFPLANCDVSMFEEILPEDSVTLENKAVKEGKR